MMYCTHLDVLYKMKKEIRFVKLNKSCFNTLETKSQKLYIFSIHIKQNVCDVNFLFIGFLHLTNQHYAKSFRSPLFDRQIIR